jgi:hypothetical protein
MPSPAINAEKTGSGTLSKLSNGPVKGDKRVIVLMLSLLLSKLS